MELFAALVPFPKKFEATGNTFVLKPFAEVSEVFGKAIEVFREYSERIYGISFADSVPNEGYVRFVLDKALAEEEYKIWSADGNVTVFASDLVGASHGASAVLQLLTVRDGQMIMPECTVHDFPDAEWRGLMIDLARGRYPLNDILTYADLCYFYRIRVLHLHFADGMVYTLPSEKFPKLPQGYYHYDRQTVDTVARYLADRGILLVPEIEMPAHADVLVARYPDLFGSAHGNMICPGCPGVFDALDTLIGEICDMFPNSPYIHIGCDEAEYSKWDECPDCRKFMEEHGISSSEKLYSYTVDRTTRMVLSHGRRPIVWEGFTAEGAELLPREVIVMVFQSTYHDAKQLTSAGFKVINTSWQPLYIVPSRPKYWQPEDIYRWRTQRWLYEDAEDDSSAIDVEDANSVLGAELCVWESVDFGTDGEIVCSNLPAVAERTWNFERRFSYEDYRKCAEAILKKIQPMIQNRSAR